MRIIIIIISLVFFTNCASITPKPRPWTRNEKIGAAFFLAGHAADTYTTIQHQKYTEIHEINPILSKHPSNSRIYTYMGITAILVLVTAHYFPKLRLPICIGFGGLGFYLAWWNYNLIEE